MTYAIHLITRANTSLLARVAEDVFDEAIQHDLLLTYVSDPRHALLVAEEDGLVVGQIRGNIHLQPDRAPDLYVDNLGTAASHQRRGVATAMIRALVNWGMERGCTYVWVATETDNAGGISFYEAQKYERRQLEWFGADLGADADGD